MDFPEYKKNAQRTTEPVQIRAPKHDTKRELDPARDPQERLVDQQWRDAERLRLHEQYPLSLNRDAEQVTTRRR